MTSAAHDTWVDEARAVPVLDAAARVGATLRRQGAEHVGPCPACGGRRDKLQVHPAKGVWTCGHGDTGGDAIALVQHIEACDFLTACAILTGRPRPGGEPETSAEREARRQARAVREAEAARAAEARDEASARFREGERRDLYRVWRAARPVAGTPAEAYLAARGLPVPPGARLRFAADHPLWAAASGGRPATLLHRGPALLAGITAPDDEGRPVFRGLHATWLDPFTPSGKAEVPDPETGEVQPAKKMRGSAGGGRIELVRVDEPERLILGEGIETALSVWHAMAIEDPAFLEGCAVWAAMSLGNMAGRAVGRMPHPTARILRRDGKDGGPRRVSSAEPDFASVAVAIPDSVRELILLGDGDSDPFETGLALERAGRRHAIRSHGRTRLVRIVPAPAGLDFNDVLRGVEAERSEWVARGIAV